MIKKNKTSIFILAMITTLCFSINSYKAYAYSTDDDLRASSVDAVTFYKDINENNNGSNIMKMMIGNNKIYTIDNVDKIYYEKLIEDKIIEFTNTFRAENNLKPLEQNDVLTFSARYKCISLQKLDYFEHSNPNMNNCASGELSFNLGYDNWDSFGENIYRMSADYKLIQVSAYDIFNAWKNSPGHRANMLRPQYQYIGVGVTIGQDNNNKIIVEATQHFAQDELKPQNSQLDFSILENKEPEENKEPISTATPSNSEQESSENKLSNSTSQNKVEDKTQNDTSLSAKQTETETKAQPTGSKSSSVIPETAPSQSSNVSSDGHSNETNTVPENTSNKTGDTTSIFVLAFSLCVSAVFLKKEFRGTNKISK